MARGVAACGGGVDIGAQGGRDVGGHLSRVELREDRLSGGTDRDGVPRAGALGDARDGVPRFDAGERDALRAVQDGEEAGHAEFVRDGGQLRQRLRLEVVGDAGGESGHAGAEAHGAARIAGHEAVILERAQEAVGDGAMHIEAAGDVVDGQRTAGVREHLEDADAAAQRLRGGGGGALGHGSPCDARGTGLGCVQ